MLVVFGWSAFHASDTELSWRHNKRIAWCDVFRCLVKHCKSSMPLNNLLLHFLFFHLTGPYGYFSSRILQSGAEGRSLRKKLLLITARHTQQMNAGDVTKWEISLKNWRELWGCTVFPRCPNATFSSKWVFWSLGEGALTWTKCHGVVEFGRELWRPSGPALAEAGPHGGCSNLCLGIFWRAQRRETPQPL